MEYADNLVLCYQYLAVCWPGEVIPVLLAIARVSVFQPNTLTVFWRSNWPNIGYEKAFARHFKTFPVSLSVHRSHLHYRCETLRMHELPSPPA